MPPWRFPGGLLLLVGVQAHIVVGHGVKEIQLLRDLAQHLAPGLQVCAQQLLVDGAVHGAVDPGLGLLLELLGAQAADVLRVDGPQLEGVKDGGGLEMPSGDQILTSSGREKISCSAYSPLGLQPSRQI